MSKYANVYGNRPNTKSCTSFPVRGFLVDATAYAVLSLNIFLIASVEYDLGRSRAGGGYHQTSAATQWGQHLRAPSARSQMSWAATPKARETPKRTV